MDKCLDKNKKKAARVVSNFHIVCYPIKRKKKKHLRAAHTYTVERKKERECLIEDMKS